MIIYGLIASMVTGHVIFYWLFGECNIFVYKYIYIYMCVCVHLNLSQACTLQALRKTHINWTKLKTKHFLFVWHPFFLDQVLSYTVSRVKSAKSVLIMHNNVILYFILLLHLNIIPFKQTTQTKCI